MSDGIFTGIRLRDLHVVGSTWFRFAMRSGGGVISLFIVVVLGLAVTAMGISQAETTIKGLDPRTGKNLEIDPDQLAERVDGAVEPILSFVYSDQKEGKKEVEFLTRERPPVLSAVLMLLMYLVPFAACSAAFNQTAADIGSRGLRFLLSRTERPNIFLGRFLSAAAFLALALFFLVAVVSLYVRLRFGFYETGTVAFAALEAWWLLFVFSLPFIALCSWISSTQRSPFASFALCYAIALAPWVIIKIAVNTMAGAGVEADWLRLLTPWDWRYGLGSFSATTRLESHAVMLGFTVVFLVIGLVNFKKRDL